jgi:hypothetical protein
MKGEIFHRWTALYDCVRPAAPYEGALYPRSPTKRTNPLPLARYPWPATPGPLPLARYPWPATPGPLSLARYPSPAVPGLSTPGKSRACTLSRALRVEHFGWRSAEP